MKKILLVATALIASTTASYAAAETTYPIPGKEIQLIIPWAAGGGTDAIGRMIANGLERELGATVIVINRTGGAGVIAHSEIGKSKPDGHTIGLPTVDLVTYKWLGMADLTYEDLTPIALLNTDAATFTVGKKSPWKSVKEALAAIKDAPKDTYSLASVPGSGNHLSVASLLMADGIDPNKILSLPLPFTNGMMELASGGVEITPFSLPESKPMIDSGEAIPLAVFSKERVPGFDNVPTIGEATGHNIIGGTWRGIAGPKGLPDDIREKIETALKKVYDSEEFQNFMKKHSFGLSWMDSKEFTEFLKLQTDQFGSALEAVGLRKN